jgi:hypothetical protein
MLLTEKKYKGHHFKTQLEARWGAFFDYAGIIYEYEPEYLDNGFFRPNFYLNNITMRGTMSIGIFVQVENKLPLKEDGTRLERSMMGLERSGLMLVGNPTAINIVGNGCFQLSYNYGVDEFWWDNCLAFCKCYMCGAIKIEFRENNQVKCDTCGEQSDAYNPILQFAKDKSMQAIL